jgi:hypothetical protein
MVIAMTDIDEADVARGRHGSMLMYSGLVTVTAWG